MDDTHTNEVAARRWGLSSRLGLAAAVIGLIGLTGLWIWSSQREARALRDLPAGERQALYVRTMENLQTVCRSERAPDLVEFCSQQAEIAVGLPECDDACRTLAHRFYRKPAR